MHFFWILGKHGNATGWQKKQMRNTQNSNSVCKILSFLPKKCKNHSSRSDLDLTYISPIWWMTNTKRFILWCRQIYEKHHQCHTLVNMCMDLNVELQLICTLCREYAKKHHFSNKNADSAIFQLTDFHISINNVRHLVHEDKMDMSDTQFTCQKISLKNKNRKTYFFKVAKKRRSPGQ